MLVSRMRSWVSLNIVLIVILALNDVANGSPAELVGTVYCDVCSRLGFSRSSHFMSGALVAVECGGDRIQVSGMKQRFWEEVKTDEKGEFRVKLPFAVSEHVEMINGCSVKLISSSEPDCAVAVATTLSSIRLKVKTPEKRIFSAGFFTFKPVKEPEVCNQPRIKNSDCELNAPTPFPSPFGGVILPAGIPIASITSEKQTRLKPDDLDDANAFGLPFPPNTFQPPSLVSPFPFQPPPDSMFTPVFQSPPYSMITPVPFQPPPDSVFDPLPFPQSPPSLIPQLLPPPPPPPPPPLLFPSFPFPPLEPLPPGFIQQPPPPPSTPPATFLPPFPPFPFQPTPGFPGMPPATSSAQLKKTSSP